ncbi:MAG: DUF2062 domain-containing protein [Verrucomicrobiales bacterium]|jgi:uncharacterized protein (DUF2062 family)|nr:DUF2062 domain-containing protein [Verrucomicrobiales bacterium]
MKLKFYRRLHRAGLSRAKLRGGWMHGWLGDCLLEKKLWLPRRNAVARAGCIGLLVALSPFFGLHTIISTFLAIVFRANIPLTFAIQWVTNVFTAPFYYAGAYLFGCWVLRIPSRHLGIIKNICENFWDYFLLRKHFHHDGGSVEHIFAEAVWPLFLGCTLLGIICGVTTYLLVKWLWRGQGTAGRSA